MFICRLSVICRINYSRQSADSVYAKSTVSDLRRSQSGILPRTVFLTIRDCRPIRCTSHDPLYLRSFSLCSDGRQGSAVYLLTMAARALARITRRIDPARLANNGRGLRSDHNCERRKRNKKTSKKNKRSRRRRGSPPSSHCYRLACSSCYALPKDIGLDLCIWARRCIIDIRTPRLVNIRCIGSIRTSYRKNCY